MQANLLPNRRALYGIFGLLFSGLPIMAQQPPHKNHHGHAHHSTSDSTLKDVLMDEVVISANRSQTLRKEAPVVVGVVGKGLLEQTNAVCLAQGLNFQPGLRVENNCQNCGFQQVRINGLDGPYTQLLIDSRPIFSALTGVYGIEQIPASMIERIEVIRGGGSAMFGANAIAGTVNIITREPSENSATIGNTTSLIGGKVPDVSTWVNATVASKDGKSGIFLFGQGRDRGHYDHDGDDFSEIGMIEARTLGFRGFYKPSSYDKLTVNYHSMQEFRRGGNRFDRPAHETDITEQTEHRIHGGGLQYEHFSKDSKQRMSAYFSGQHTLRNSYYGAGQDPNAYGNTVDDMLVGGLQYQYFFDKLGFMPAELLLGSEYQYNGLEDRMPGYGRALNQKTHNVGLFAQNEWKNSRWGLLLGGRIDKHNLIEKPIFSPRANLRYTPLPSLVLRGSFGMGFRAPQAFDEDLHITAVGGEVTLIRLADDLRTERSSNYTLSGEYSRSIGDWRMSLMAEAFYTHLRDVFVLEQVGTDQQGNLLLERRNGSGATVKGINLESSLRYNRMEWQLGATWQQSRYEDPLQWSENVAPQKRMFRAPDFYGYVTALYKPTNALQLSLSGIYTGSMLVQHFAGYVPQDQEKLTPSFFELNAKVAYDFKLGKHTLLQLHVGGQNLLNAYQDDFDQGMDRDAGYIYGPGTPRSLVFGGKISI